MEWIKCENCKGKGHVMDGVAAALIPVVGWVLAFTEKNDPEGVTRQKCTKCDGTGYIKLKQ